MDAFRALYHLNQDFLHHARQYGRIIISELYLPDDEKTIKPLRVGGVAGGSKFVAANILFKLAVDVNDFYGSDFHSMKVAGHELRGLISYSNAGIPDLSLPLLALIDYRGCKPFLFLLLLCEIHVTFLNICF